MKAIRFLLLLLATASPAAAQQILFDKPVKAGALTVFRDLRDEKAYYYEPANPHLASDANGVPQFSFFRWVENLRPGERDAEARAGEGAGGGIIHALVTFGATKEMLAEAQRDLARQVSGAKIAGPIVPKSGTFALISTMQDPKDPNNKFSTQVLGLGNAPVLDGEKAAISIKLTKYGAKVLWEQFQTPTPDLSFQFEWSIDGFRGPIGGTVEANLDEIVKHDAFAAGIAGNFFGAEIKGVFDDLRRKNVIKVTQIGDDAKLAEAIKTAYDKLVEVLFEKTSPAAAAAAPVAAGAGEESMLTKATAQLGAARTYSDKVRADNNAIEQRNAERRAKREAADAAEKRHRDLQEELRKAEVAATPVRAPAPMAAPVQPVPATPAAVTQPTPSAPAQPAPATSSPPAAAGGTATAPAPTPTADPSAASAVAPAQPAPGSEAGGAAAPATATPTPATATPAASTPATATPAASTPATATPAASTPTTATPAASTPATPAPETSAPAPAPATAAPAPQVTPAPQPAPISSVPAPPDPAALARVAQLKVDVEAARVDALAKRQEATKAGPDEALKDMPAEPGFAIMASYQFKRSHISGIYRVDLNKYLAETRVIPVRENIGDMRPLFKSGAFRQVNLDDPLYKQREIVATLDVNADDFGQYVNFVSLRLRKTHESGELTDDEIRIDRKNFNLQGANFTMLYGWKGDNNRQHWMDYEYQTVWSFAGGHTMELPWQKSSSGEIALAPPLQRRSVELQGDPKTLAGKGVRAVSVKVYYHATADGPEQVKQLTLNPAAPNFVGRIDFVAPQNSVDYEYEIAWRLTGNREVTTGRQKTSFTTLSVDDVPASTSGQ